MSQYVPRNPTFKIDPDLATFLRQEFQRVADAVNLPAERRNFVPLSVAPTKPREGDDVYADGVNWDPGSGKGRYNFDGTTWNFLG